MLIALVLLGVARAEPDASAEAVLAHVEQVDVPAWKARVETAERQTAARTAFFAGEASFDAAFPGLATVRLGNPTVVRGRLADLQARATAREAERLEPAIEGLSPEVAAPFLAQRRAALDAEEAADALLRRLLTRVEAVLGAHPELTDAAVEGILAETREALARVPPEDPVQAEAFAVEVAHADAELARTDAFRRALLVHALGGGPAPDAGDDLQHADAPLPATRLWMLAPEVEGEALEAVRAALAGFAGGPVMTAAQQARDAAGARLAQVEELPIERTAEELEADLPVLQGTIRRLQARLAKLPEGHPLAPLRTLELETARDDLAVTQRLLARLADKEAARTEAAAAAAAKARREAELAAAAADGDAQRMRAGILSRSADASERLEALSQKVDGRMAALTEAEAEQADLLAAYRKELAEVRDASPIPGTGPDADKLYARVRKSVEDLGQGEVARGDHIALAMEEIAEIRVRSEEEQAEIQRIDITPALAEPLREWRNALDAEQTLADELKDIAWQERRVTLKAIRELAAVRRDLRSYITWRQQEIDNSRLPTEIVRELQLLRPTVISTASTRAGEILGSPWRLLRDGRLMMDLLGSLFWTVLLLGGWYWARGKANDIAGRVAWQARRLRPDLKPIDLQRAKAPLAVAVRAAIDLGLGYLMIGRLSWISGEIAFLVECWLLLAIYRFFLGLFDLAVVRSPDFRPSVVTLGPDAYDLARLTTHVFVIWSIARGFTAYVAWGMLGMDATTTLLMTVFNLVGYGIAAWLLYRWDPLLRERMRARNQESRAVAFLSGDVRWAVLRPFSALAMLLFFTLTLFVDLVYWLLARDRTGFARLFNVISRYQMGDDDDDGRELPPEVRERLTSSESGVYVKRPALDDACNAAFNGWEREGRRGMVALVGDRGDGKRTELARFLERQKSSDHDIVRDRLHELTIEPSALLAWLARLAGVEATSDPEVLIARLKERERTVFVLEQLHRTFSRTVGGFEGFSTLLYVMNATSDHHFWLVTLHRPGWRYLASIPSIVDVGVFRSVVTLEPLEPVALRELAERRAVQAGLTLDYSTLMTSNLLGSDPTVEQERATNTFYRLLADASEGNPRVAMHLFADCLEPEEGDVVQVHLRRVLATDVLEDVSVYALFALVALRQQDSMRLAEIVSVTNLPEAVLRNITRDLQSRGLLEASGDHLYVPIQYLPIVTRTLRRRHLLYLGGLMDNVQDLENLIRFVNIDGIPFAAFVIGVAWLALRVLASLLDDFGERFTGWRLLLMKVKAVMRFATYIVVAMLVANAVLRLEGNAVVALLGPIGVAVGWGLKDLAAALMAGLILLIDEPFQVGDRITFDGQYGEVTEIGLRSVRIATLDDNLVTIPNNKFLTDSVASANAGALDAMVVVPFYIAAAEDFQEARRIVAEATATSRYAYLKKPVVTLISDEFLGERFVTIVKVKAYVFDVRFEKDFITDVTERVKLAFRRLGIRTPDRAYRDLEVYHREAPPET